MDSYEVLKTVHKVGHPISGIVTGHTAQVFADIGLTSCNIEVKTASRFKTILPYQNLFDGHELKAFDLALLPRVGIQINAVVANHVDGVLYLNASPNSTSEEQMARFKAFYQLIEQTEPGTVLMGRVERVVPFGLFVDLSLPFAGLIDIGHSSFNKGQPLPYNNSKWPRKGDLIKCIVSYFRFHNLQIGLGWLPE